MKSCGNNVLVSKQAVLVGMENIVIHDNVRIDSYVVIIASRGPLLIKSNVHIEPLASLVSHHGISIGSFCTISHGVRLFTASADYSGNSFTNRFPQDKFQNPIVGGIEIKDHVIIGANSVVMPNIIIEEGAAVGALSFVRKSLAAWKIYAGNPLREIRDREATIKFLGNDVLPQ
jgi:acetyltransferase-like isoleucine patch superfamily enzyme